MIRRPQSQTFALPSLLDRLLDDAPDEPQRDAVLLFDISGFKAALARDLEDLLNTRVMELGELAGQYPEAAKSVLRFGIPDLSSLSLLSPYDRERLRQEVQCAVEVFESRLSQVKVTINMPENPRTHQERMLHFRVDGTLIIHPRRPPVSFDATLQLSSFAYRVRDRS